MANNEIHVSAENLAAASCSSRRCKVAGKSHANTTTAGAQHLAQRDDRHERPCVARQRLEPPFVSRKIAFLSVQILEAPIPSRSTKWVILSYIDIGKKEGAKLFAGGERAKLGGDLAGGFYVRLTRPPLLSDQAKIDSCSG
jgi:hypothetical protein